MVAFKACIICSGKMELVVFFRSNVYEGYRSTWQHEVLKRSKFIVIKCSINEKKEADAFKGKSSHMH